MSANRNLRDTLLDGLERLIREGSNKKFWLSTRAISDSIMALNFCLPSSEFNKLKRSSLQYMLSEGEELLNHTLSWHDEVWDTSVAAMALATEPVIYSTEILKAYKWIKSKYLLTHTSWNEEVWETLLALNSISYLHKNVPATYDSKCDYKGAIEWLMKMVDTPKKGLLINWSSTALFILLAHSHALPSMTEELELKLKSASQKCANAIFEAPILHNEELLWTPEAWSNGLVLWALSVAKPGVFSVEKSFKISKWFKERISLKDLPTEDRAFSCIGLYKYLEYMETSKFDNLTTADENSKDNLSVRFEELKEKLQERIAINLKQRVSDFQSSPPLFTRYSYKGYYSINLKAIIINVILIVGTTCLLSYLTWQSQDTQDNKIRWVVLVPIFLGTLATIAQLANFNLLPNRKRKKGQSNVLDEED